MFETSSESSIPTNILDAHTTPILLRNTTVDHVEESVDPAPHLDEVNADNNDSVVDMLHDVEDEMQHSEEDSVESDDVVVPIIEVPAPDIASEGIPHHVREYERELLEQVRELEIAAIATVVYRI
ncbi:hypothetical protein K7X08_009854 [Anisodus acutangulus]|uniref:Uncharacterized protein n=1 Tax=Anisodus acutangulus TaxID=402998 RepID=A0A9Q1N3R4_9SOLA|nr:hypothetical protein K7X08_009854 [Anisodus acutangulus]